MNKKALLIVGMGLIIGFIVYLVLNNNTEVDLEEIVFVDEDIKKEDLTNDDIKYIEDGNNLNLIIKGQAKQTITLDSYALDGISVAPLAKKFITDLDVNFDGFNDVGVFVSTAYSGVSNYYDFYIFNPDTLKLEKNEYLKSISDPAVDTLGGINNVVISTYRSGPFWYSDLYFQYSDNSYQLEKAEEPNPNMGYEYFAFRPIKTIPDIPLREVFLPILNDAELDISIINNNGNIASFILLPKEENRNKERRFLGFSYYEDVIMLDVVSKEDLNEILLSNTKQINGDLAIDGLRKEQIDFLNSILESNIKNGNQKIGDNIWKYFDEINYYDGGYWRNYYREKDGYVIMFALSNEMVEENPNLSEIQKIQFINKLDL